MSLTSPDLTVVPLGSSAVLIDTNGNQWGLTLSGVLTFNGAIDATTTKVSQIALVKGIVWQQGAGHGTPLWWSSPTLKPGKWVGGLAPSPFPNVVVSQ